MKEGILGCLGTSTCGILFHLPFFTDLNLQTSSLTNTFRFRVQGLHGERESLLGLNRGANWRFMLVWGRVLVLVHGYRNLHTEHHFGGIVNPFSAITKVIFEHFLTKNPVRVLLLPFSIGFEKTLTLTPITNTLAAITILLGLRFISL